MPLHPKGHLCFVLGKILALKTPPIHTAYIWKDWWPGGREEGEGNLRCYCVGEGCRGRMMRFTQYNSPPASHHPPRTICTLQPPPYGPGTTITMYNPVLVSGSGGQKHAQGTGACN
jgi:hypothetical protein